METEVTLEIYQARIRYHTCILQRSIGTNFENVSDGWEVGGRIPVGSHKSAFTHKIYSWLLSNAMIVNQSN